MKKVKLLGFSLITLNLSVLSTARNGGKGKTIESGDGKGNAAHSTVIIADTSGAGDKPFNRSSWEGLQTWDKEHNLPKGSKGYAYTQSNDTADYATNIDQAASSKFNTIFGVSYLLRDTISSAADANPDTNLVLIDDQIDDRGGVVSITFRDNETACLASAVVVNKTKTNRADFVGSEEGVVINRFQTSLEKGMADTAKELGEEVTTDTRYAASFANPAKEKVPTTVVCQDGVDIIFHASGATGQGVFQEMRNLNESGSGDRVWVIGVDHDQGADGKYKARDGKEDDFALVSTLKGVDAAVQDITNRALEDKSPGGEHLVYGLRGGGADLTDGYLSDKAGEAIRTARGKVISGDVKTLEKSE